MLCDTFSQPHGIMETQEKAVIPPENFAFRGGVSCKEEGVEAVYLPRTPEISSTQIKNDLNCEEKDGNHPPNEIESEW